MIGFGGGRHYQFTNPKKNAHPEETGQAVGDWIKNEC